jgi:predicted nucleotidyltransferase
LVIDAVDGLQTVLDADWIGIYVFGSIVTGDFDEALSDIDIVAVTPLSSGRALFLEFPAH